MTDGQDHVLSQADALTKKVYAYNFSDTAVKIKSQYWFKFPIITFFWQQEQHQL